MNLAQSPHIPEAGKKPGLKDLHWLFAYSARGLWELARARIIFARLQARQIPARNRAARASGNSRAEPPIDALARIYYVLPRLSERLPWRSDCLIQAIAAQNWLSAIGVVGEIRIGFENPADGQFGAHAWLVHDEHVVTGGEIERYHLLLSEPPLDQDS